MLINSFVLNLSNDFYSTYNMPSWHNLKKMKIRGIMFLAEVLAYSNIGCTYYMHNIILTSDKFLIS